MAKNLHPYQDRIDKAKTEVPGHEIVAAWRQNDPKLAADAILFWQEMDRLPDDVTPEERAKELVCVAYDNGAVIGVATAEIGRYPLLRQKFAFWRVLVHPDYRRHGMRVAISHFVNTFFAAWSIDHPEEKLAGMGGVVSTTYPRPEGYRPVTRVSKSVAVGYNEFNQLVRIKWFDHVRF